MPLALQKRRTALPRLSEDDDDESELDAMLGELGIPTSDRNSSRDEQERKTETVIELITPPRPIRHTSLPPTSTSESITLDLTTPTPPSGAKNSSDAARRKSIVDLVSPDGASEPAEEQWGAATLATPSPTVDRSQSVRTPLRRLLDAVDRDDAKSDDEGSEDDSAVLPLRDRLAARRPLLFDRPSEAMSPTRRNKRARGVTDPEPDEEIAPMISTIERPREGAATPRAAKKSKSSHPASESVLVSPTAAGRKPKKSKKPVQVAIVALQQSLAESDAGQAIAQALATNSYNNRSIPTQQDAAFSASLPVIQWERRRCVDEDTSVGSMDPIGDRFTLALHCPADTFLGWIDGQGHEGLLTIACQLQKMPVRIASSAQLNRRVTWSSIIFIVEGMDRALIGRKKRAKKTNAASTTSDAVSVSTFSELHELTFQLFMDTGAHTKFTCDSEATAAYVAMVTRELLVAAQRQSTQEEFLESVPRVHSFRVMPRSGSTVNAFGNTWLRMLQMIPGVSEDRAQSLLNHFPTFASLMAVYRDPKHSQREKEDLLADKLSDGRMESALSKRIFHIFGSNDPSLNV
ncbi:hypothetical protein ATCC90586_005436 [Pythium insidiosum]|nr:hypothetical protein ATCC90586_005436 [Pythium insidiosum]